MCIYSCQYIRLAIQWNSSVLQYDLESCNNGNTSGLLQNMHTYDHQLQEIQGRIKQLSKQTVGTKQNANEWTFYSYTKPVTGALPLVQPISLCLCTHQIQYAFSFWPHRGISM